MNYGPNTSSGELSLVAAAGSRQKAANTSGETVYPVLLQIVVCDWTQIFMPHSRDGQNTGQNSQKEDGWLEEC